MQQIRPANAPPRHVPMWYDKAIARAMAVAGCSSAIRKQMALSQMNLPLPVQPVSDFIWRRAQFSSAAPPAIRSVSLSGFGLHPRA
ncbi:hypothetical protein KCP70_17595 [Salmonella enterica subsp. enterica]|nr:hypothetical protein KCP70_17595 [Salmonella enterica subsp. enterica]